MARLCILSLLAVLAHGAVERKGPSSNPVEGVVKLISRLEKKIQEEGKTEAAAYDKFACFCKDQADEKLFSITKKGARIAELAASIKKLTAEIEQFTETMEEAKKRKADLEGESKTKIQERADQKQTFLDNKADLVQGINEILKAIEEVKASAESQKGSALVELSSRVQTLAAPEGDAKAYAFKGKETIETLQKLHKDFKARLNKLVDEEGENRHTHDMQEGARQNEIMAKALLIIKCQDVIGQKSQQKSDEEKEHGEQKKDKKEDEEFLAEVTDQCEEKAGKWDARSKRRMNELTAVSECLAILKGDATAKYGSNSLALAQKQAPAQAKGHWEFVSGVSFLQVQAEPKSVASRRALSHLAKQASLLRSSSLQALVMQLNENPFQSVKKMIEDLITKIDDEQAAEESEIEDCKNDMEDNTKKRAKNSAKMEEEQASVLELGSAISDHKEDIKTLAFEISELFKELNEATQLRNKEKKDNAQTLVDARAGNDSMGKAIKVLKDFYESDFEKASLLQSGAPDIDAPGGDEGGDFLGDDADADVSKQGEAKGIMGLLNTIKGDYENTITTTEQDEKDAETEFKSYKTQCDKDIEDKKKAKKQNENRVVKASTDIEQAKEDYIQWTDQKKEAEYELSILTPRCLGLGASAEERKKRREEEKKALKDAITILDTMGPAEAPEASTDDGFLQIKKH